MASDASDGIEVALTSGNFLSSAFAKALGTIEFLRFFEALSVAGLVDS